MYLSIFIFILVLILIVAICPEKQSKVLCPKDKSVAIKLHTKINKNFSIDPVDKMQLLSFFPSSMEISKAYDIGTRTDFFNNN